MAYIIENQCCVLMKVPSKESPRGVWTGTTVLTNTCYSKPKIFATKAKAQKVVDRLQAKTPNGFVGELAIHKVKIRTEYYYD